MQMKIRWRNLIARIECNGNTEDCTSRDLPKPELSNESRKQPKNEDEERRRKSKRKQWILDINSIVFLSDLGRGRCETDGREKYNRNEEGDLSYNVI